MDNIKDQIEMTKKLINKFNKAIQYCKKEENKNFFEEKLFQENKRLIDFQEKYPEYFI